jgi:hypothetical protein
MQPEQQPASPAPSQSPNGAVAPIEPVAEGSTTLPEQQPIQWQAPEYLQERRSPWWFIGFWVVVLILMVLAVVVIRSWSFAILIPAMAAALTIYSHRPPRQLNYVLSSKGIYINEKLHPMSEFRSFGVIQEDSLPSIMLIPVKRFRPGLTIHFPNEAGEVIVDMLGSRIPMQNIKLDVFDKLIRQLHL